MPLFKRVPVNMCARVLAVFLLNDKYCNKTEHKVTHFFQPFFFFLWIVISHWPNAIRAQCLDWLSITTEHVLIVFPKRRRELLIFSILLSLNLIWNTVKSTINHFHIQYIFHIIWINYFYLYIFSQIHMLMNILIARKTTWFVRIVNRVMKVSIWTQMPMKIHWISLKFPNTAIII